MSHDLAAEQRLREELETAGLWLQDTQGPSYAQLRPYGPTATCGLPPYNTPGFPVHPHLEEILLDATEHPQDVIAHVMATCAGYAYAGAEVLSTVLARMGLERNNCRMIRTSVDGMFICSTAFLIQSRTGRVAILCYRGTEPTNLINWMTNLDLSAQKTSYYSKYSEASAHSGFYRNVRATRHQVTAALKAARRGQSIRCPLPAETNGARAPKMRNKLEALYITGHSLGGAMAALMAVMLRHEQKYWAVGDNEDDLAGPLRAVYTFGQPMIGNPAFAEASGEDPFFQTNMIRYIYDKDIVPHLPAHTSGRFEHLGRELRYEVPNTLRGISDILKVMRWQFGVPEGRWKEQKTYTGQLWSTIFGVGTATASFLFDKIQPLRFLPFPYSIDHHFPQRYINALRICGKTDEFGD